MEMNLLKYVQVYMYIIFLSIIYCKGPLIDILSDLNCLTILTYTYEYIVFWCIFLNSKKLIFQTMELNQPKGVRRDLLII